MKDIVSEAEAYIPSKELKSIIVRSMNIKNNVGIHFGLGYKTISVLSAIEGNLNKNLEECRYRPENPDDISNDELDRHIEEKSTKGFSPKTLQ
ncbi:hypothetical protein SAMN05216391_1097 [Lachnospiraceae bacterium KHCPX20]|nr:hypothetical protein SAMN05216391_1097 [Lachnospiraceae bacterium KHCPX20]